MAEPASSSDGTDPAALAELTSIRQSIDNIDAALVHLLAERFKFTQQVGRLKAEHGMAPSDPAREKVQIARLRTRRAPSTRRGWRAGRCGRCGAR
jgi:chorismate mutase